MMSMIEQISYTVSDETERHPRLRGLAAPDAALLRSAREPSAPRRRAAALAGAVPRAAPHRAGPADSDGAARRDARLRCVERDGVGGPARVARSHPPPSVRQGSTGESVGPDANRFAAPHAAGRSDDHAA